MWCEMHTLALSINLLRARMYNICLSICGLDFLVLRNIDNFTFKKINKSSTFTQECGFSFYNNTLK